MSQWSQDEYIKALKFAAEAHNGRKVPGTDIPYLFHISLVSMEVLSALASEKVDNGNLAVQCALLHDVIEDTETTYEQVETLFGIHVANGVQALSKEDYLPKDEKMADSLARIRLQPKEVWMVKLADRITNLQPPPSHWTLEKKKAYQAEAVTILEALGEASDYLAERLRGKIAAYDEFF